MRRRDTWVLALLFGITACSAPGVPSQRPGSSVARVLMPSDPASLSLIGRPDRNSEIFAAQLTDSLVQYDSTLRWVPRVARSWEFSDDHHDLTFHLRDDVRWHDGVPVTADDVAFTVELAQKPILENRVYAPLLALVSGVEVVDRLTLRAHYPEPTPDALEAWRIPLIPRHRAGADADLLASEFARSPVGCGPFRFEHYRVGEEISLVANEDYWDGRPGLDRLVFRIFRDQRTSYQALRRGELDLVVLAPELWAEALRSAEAARWKSFVYSSLSVWWIGWNMDGSNPFFVDARVRMALAHALDRETFASRVLNGLARPAVTFYHPDSPWADPELKPRAYDRALAARLLDEAGWVDHDGDGTRDRAGKPFRFRMLVAVSSMQIVDLMLAWQQAAWSSLGVQVEIEKVDFQRFRELRAAHRFDAFQGTNTFTPSPDLYELLHSSQRDSGVNYIGLTDPEIDRLTQEGRDCFDPELRLEIYRALQRRIYETEAVSAQFHFSSPVIHDRHLAGIHPSPIDIYRTADGPRLWHWTAQEPFP